MWFEIQLWLQLICRLVCILPIYGIWIYIGKARNKRNDMIKSFIDLQLECYGDEKNNNSFHTQYLHTWFKCNKLSLPFSNGFYVTQFDKHVVCTKHEIHA